MKSVLCDVYRSPRKAEMYLYVTRDQDLAELPAPLLSQFGAPELALSLMLGPDRKLARADAVTVLEALESQGFYLQMPPTPDELLRRDGND